MLDKVYKLIDIDKLVVNKDQPRQYFDEEKIEELSESIINNGLIQPIVVVKQNKEYLIVAGERRYRACKKANLEKVPCIIKNYSASQIDSLALIENIQREDLSPVEEAKAYKALLDNSNMSQSELASQVGKKQSTIANKIRLLKLSSKVQEKVASKEITERHARALMGLSEAKQEEVLDVILTRHLNVSATEKYILSLKPKIHTTMKTPTSHHVKLATNTINKAIDMLSKAHVEVSQETMDLEDEYVITLHIRK